MARDGRTLIGCSKIKIGIFDKMLRILLSISLHFFQSVNCEYFDRSEHFLTDDQYHVRGKSGGGILPYLGYIGMCSPKGYSFSAVLVINRVSIFAL